MSNENEGAVPKGVDEGVIFQSELWNLLMNKHRKMKTPLLMDVLADPANHGIKNVFPEMMRVIHRMLRRQGFVSQENDIRHTSRLYKTLLENGKEDIL